MVVHRGSCHCGKVKFEVDAPSNLELSECICSSCYMVGFEHIHVPKSRFRVLEGKDVTIITYSRMRHHCIKAVEQLRNEGIESELIDLISLKPFDMQTIARSIRKTHRVIIVEECMKTGGIGAELISLISGSASRTLKTRDAPTAP